MSNNDNSDSKERKNRPSKLGRKGDPRMHRSVAARLGNPNLTLLEALRLGGFDFPSGGGDDATILDSDGVTLGQRKNQLSRRLRLAKQQQMEDGGDDNGSLTNENSSVSRGRRQVGGKQLQQATAQASSASVDFEKVLQAARNASRQSGSLKRTSSDALSISDNEDEGKSPTKDSDMQDEVARMAKFHPMFVPQTRANLSTWNNPIEAAAAQQAQAAAAFAAQAQLRQTPSQFSSYNSLLTNPQVPIYASNPSSHTSGVAVASLKSTASSVGMTLEQLAVALSTANVAKILQGDKSDDQTKHDLALSLYKGESNALYKKCMLMAGYDASQTEENQPEYLQFVLKAWQSEGKRLENMHSSEMNRVTEATTAVIAKSTSNAKAIATKEGAESKETTSKDCAHSHSHDHDHNANSEENPTSCFDGRHIHRLEGKCGHKAILHQPDDGPAHVDFVIDGKIECYQGIKPVGTNGALWPSKYKCDQLSCPNDGDCKQNNVTCGENICQKECTEFNMSDPKVLEDVDLAGKEWNTSFFDANNGQIDNTLLGLITLGDSSSGMDDSRAKSKSPVEL